MIAGAASSFGTMLATMIPQALKQNEPTSSTTTSLYMIVVGTGLGFFFQMTTTIAQNSVTLPDMGAATSAIALFRTLGGAVAVAIFGALAARALGGLSGPAAGPAYIDAVAMAARWVFLGASVLGAIGIVAALLIKEVRLRGGTSEGGVLPLETA